MRIPVAKFALFIPAEAVVTAWASVMVVGAVVDGGESGAACWQAGKTRKLPSASRDSAVIEMLFISCCSWLDCVDDDCLLLIRCAKSCLL